MNLAEIALRFAVARGRPYNILTGIGRRTARPHAKEPIMGIAFGVFGILGTLYGLGVLISPDPGTGPVGAMITLAGCLVTAAGVVIDQLGYMSKQLEVLRQAALYGQAREELAAEQSGEAVASLSPAERAAARRQAQARAEQDQQARERYKID